MKLLLLFPIVALFSACVSFQPRVGMSLGELRHMTAKSFNGSLESSLDVFVAELLLSSSLLI